MNSYYCRRKPKKDFIQNCNIIQFNVFQNATQGTLVAQFNATDADLNQNAEIGYRIVSGNGDGVFDINNHTGELFTVKELDHEKVTQYQVWLSISIPENMPICAYHCSFILF